MKITILGTWGAYPEADSATSSYLLQTEGFNLLIDCGSGSLSKLQTVLPLNQLDALILSHYHYDHIADVGCLQYGLMIQQQLGNRNGIFPIYGHNLDLEKFRLLDYPNITKGIVIGQNAETDIGPFHLNFCPTIHPVYGLAIRFQYGDKSIVYTGDTEWTDILVEFSSNADILIAEANLYNEQLGKVMGHLTAGQAGLLAAKSAAKKLVLTHLPHFGNHDELVKQAKEEFNGEVVLASSGLTFEL